MNIIVNCVQKQHKYRVQITETVSGHDSFSVNSPLSQTHKEIFLKNVLKNLLITSTSTGQEYLFCRWHF